MTVQVKHESEYYRQHVRYQIPAKLEVQGETVVLRDWSVSGVSVLPMPEKIGRMKQFEARLSFDFQTFMFSVMVEIETVRFDEESQKWAGRFVNLSKQNLSLIHYMIDAFLSGEVVLVGDVLSVATREGFIQKDFSDRLEPKRNFIQEVFFQIRRMLGYAFFLGIIFGLLFFVANTLYERLFVIESLSARVLGNVTVLRAPDNGFFQNTLNGQNTMIKKGQLMGIVKLVGGGASSLESPCTCKVLNILAENGVFVGKGEPLYSVLGDKSVLRIEAQISFEDVRRIRVGNEAEIRLTDGSIVKGKIIKIRSNTRTEALQAAPLRHLGLQAPEYATAIIKPESIIDMKHIDTVAYVRVFSY